MDSAKRPSSYFIFDDVLVDVVFRLPIFFVVRVLRMGIQRLFNCAVVGGRTTVVPERTLVGGG
jgi:hypothetical protein